MKRKNVIKSIIAIALCMVIALTGLDARTVSAAENKCPVKVTFNGKTVTLVKDQNDWESTPTLKTLKSKWGKPKTKTDDSGVKYYTWKKGKTTIQIMDFMANENGIGFTEIQIKDKNGAIWGVKVGMKRAAAIKKIEKATGEKIPNDVDHIFAGGVNFMIKNGKVSEISYARM